MSTNAACADGISIIDGDAPTTSAIVTEDVTGWHVLQIRGYSRIVKRICKGKFIESSNFSVGDYLWNIRYYPNGEVSNDATTDWTSIYLQHDATDVAEEVIARFVFGVLDDSGESVPMFSSQISNVKTFSSENQGWGFSKFFKRKDLEELSCLKDDCLKLRCNITVSKAIRTEPTMQLVAVPPSNMHQHFGSLLSGAVGAEVTFDVAGEVFAAHRCVLAARSPVFMAELFGHMKEKAVKCIQINDMEARVFKAMLHFIYTDTMPEIDADVFEVVQQLLVAADRYDLERLKLISEDRLCMCIDTSTVATTLAIAEQLGCHGLKNACFQLLMLPSHLETVMETESFDHLLATCPSLIKELLAKMASTCL